MNGEIYLETGTRTTGRQRQSGLRDQTDLYIVGPVLVQPRQQLPGKKFLIFTC